LGLLDPREASPGGEICALAVSPDGTLLATGTRDGAIRLWEASNQRSLTRWQAHEKAVTALAFFPDSRGLLTSGADRTVGRWLVRESSVPQPAGRWPVAAHVSALAVAPDGRAVAIAAGGRLSLHDTELGGLLPGSELLIPETPLRALAFSPDGKTLAGGGGGDNAVRVWALEESRPVLRLTLGEDSDNWLRGLAYANDGCTLVSLDTAGRVLAWDLAGNLLAETRAGQPPCLHAALGAGGRLMLTATGREGPARLLRLPDDWWR
jgi:WD40 repeat protein